MDPTPHPIIASTSETRCCVVGGGPAGCILSLLLARIRVPVTLLESHPDFDRDFRGDTVHPSTLELLAQLGLSDRLHQMPHGMIRMMRLKTKQGVTTLADLRRLRTPFPYVLTLPQAKLLQLLADERRKYADYRLVMQAQVQELIESDGVVRGVRYQDHESRWHEVRADLTVAADGRFSKICHLIGVESIKTAPPMDVIWFRLPKGASDQGGAAEFYVGDGHFCVLLDRGDEWQIGYVILKGSFAAVKAAGIQTVQTHLAELVPWLADRVGLLHDWNQMAVLNVESNRVTCWHKPGLLLIGDAAHVMSPVGGVGINVAVQDAIAAANILSDPLRRRSVTERDLTAVQSLREPAVVKVQQMQRMIQNLIAAPSLSADKPFRLPWWMRLISHIPWLRDMPAKMMAFGPHRVRYVESK
jgi:2-polyprenyl-6-methoxyphenol hydroxylase-like FAD-dependent oxidoreductase